MIVIDFIVAAAFGIAVEIACVAIFVAFICVLAVVADWIDWPPPPR